MEGDHSESLAAARRVDARCDEFELALATGKSPQIESFLTDLPAPERQTLLLELLGLELDFRVARGEQPKVGDYAKRFPELSAEQLAAIVEASRGRVGVIPSVGSAVPNAEQPTILSPTDAVGLANDASAAVLRRVRYFGDYELLREIARGGMGVVYEARQRSLNRPVALKMILSGQLASAEEVARFRREAEAAAQLEHPGIVPIFEIGTDGDQHYFTMGYVSGPSLSARLLERPLEPREAATLIRDVALAVQYAHERGVVHRDLKPSNILLAPRLDGSHVRQNVGQADVRPHSGECGYAPRITDFGLAKVSHADHSLTETGQILGTPSYMPPEQASGLTHEVGPAADIYSLGAVLYACLTGRPPFQAASVLDTVRQVLERDPVSLRDLNAAIPQDLETICLKCLEKSIPRRYPTAKAVADELQRYLEGRPIEARPVSRRERVWRWCRRNPVVAGLSAAVAMSLLLGIAVSSYFAWQENKRAIAESDARRDEELQRRKADRQTVIAKKLGADNLKLAEDEKAARQKADLNAEAAKQQTKLAKRNLYSAHMNLVQAAWEANRVGEAVRILELYRTAEVQDAAPEELRGFEWHYWDRCCHSELATLAAPLNTMCVTFSPDGQQLAAGCIAVNAVKTWDCVTGQELLSLKGHKAPFLTGMSKFADKNATARLEAARQAVESTIINGIAYSPDGKRMASASGDGTIKIWEVATGACQLTLSGHSHHVRSVAFSPDGERLVSTSSSELMVNTESEIKIWDGSSGKELHTINGRNGFVWSAIFSPDGNRVVSTNSEKSTAVNLWDTETGEKLLTFQGSAGAFNIAQSPNGERFATVATDGTIKIWDAARGEELRSLNGHLQAVTSVTFSPDGKRLASASDDQTLKVWNAANGQEIVTLKGHSERVNCVTFSPNGKLIASASRDGTVKLWSATTQQEARPFHSTSAANLAFSGNGKFLAVAKGPTTTHGPRDLSICEAATGNVKKSIAVPTSDSKASSPKYISQMALDHDARQVAIMFYDKTVKVFDVATGLETCVLQGHTDTVKSMAFDPKRSRLVTVSRDRTVRVWDTTNGQETLNLKGHTSYLEDVVFEPAGTWFASAGEDKTIRMWDALSGRLLRSLKGHTDNIRTLAVSRDGTRLASAGKDRTIRVWDTGTGQELITLLGHTNEIAKVAFSTDGKRLASSGDGTVKLWDAVTGAELVRFKGGSLEAFSSDGFQLILRGSAYSFFSVRDATPTDTNQRQTILAKLVQSKNEQPLADASKSVENSTVKPPVISKPAANVSGDWQGWAENAPLPAVVPFDAEHAKQSQIAWAKYFHVPVEYSNSQGLRFQIIPPGEFLRGSTPTEIDALIKGLNMGNRFENSLRSECPKHKVILTQPFYIGVQEVTQAEFEKVMERNPSHFSSSGTGKEAVGNEVTTNFPVDSVSWEDAAEFCARLSQQESLIPYYARGGQFVATVGGIGYRLPTEAEWEFACRAGTATKYWIGDTDADLIQAAWLNANTGGRTHAVGSLKPNPFGLHDINGNLWEWVQDGWDANSYGSFQDKPAINPSVPTGTLPQRVLRGGSWAGFSLFCRSSYRHSDAATLRHRNCGFRLALSVEAVKTTIARQKQTEGDKHREQQEYSETIACYREVVTHEPNNLVILNRLAWLLALSPAKDQQAAEALELAQRVSRKDPNDLYYRNSLGAAQYRAGQFAEALRNLGEVDQNAPPNFQWRVHNLFFQTMCHLKAEDRPKAQATYDNALELLKQAKGDTNPSIEARLLQKEVEELLRASATNQVK